MGNASMTGRKAHGAWCCVKSEGPREQSPRCFLSSRDSSKSCRHKRRANRSDHKSFVMYSGADRHESRLDSGLERFSDVDAARPQSRTSHGVDLRECLAGTLPPNDFNSGVRDAVVGRIWNHQAPEGCQ